MRLSRIIYDEPGQTCNRFWSYLESVSWAVLNKRKVFILFWDPSIKDYDKLRNNKYVFFPFYSKKHNNYRGGGRYVSRFHKMFASQKAYKFYRGWIGRHIGFIKGWDIRESDMFFPQVKEKIIPLFKPNDNVVNSVVSLLKDIRKECDFLVGVHIRLGDYREWKGGKYCFSYEIYAAFMRQISNLLADKSVAFYVASNELVPESVPLNEFKFFHSIGGAAEDLYALQLCDYIIGPPSTFSKWASIMGGTPLHIIYDKDEILTNMDDDFSSLVSHTKFKDGKGIW